MTLLDRVATLMRANLNDLIEKAENPEKLLRQLLLDMQNQYLQLKTQVAVAIAGEHQLEKKQQESEAAQQEWVKKAELALRTGQEPLARIALERSLTYQTAAQQLGKQFHDQRHHAALLRDSLQRLESKIDETKAQIEVLIARHRRSRTSVRAGQAHGDERHDFALDRIREQVANGELAGEGNLLAVRELSTQGKFNELEKSEKVERMLENLKQRLANA